MTGKPRAACVRAVALVGALTAVATASAAGGASLSGDGSLILFRSPAAEQSGSIALWTTDGTGRDARRVAVVRQSTGVGFRVAKLTRRGDVVYAVSEAADGNVADLYLVDHRTRRARRLFSVRGLVTFAASPDGRRIAFSSELPIAGKPATFVADLDGLHRREIAPVAASYSLSWPIPGTLFMVGGPGGCWFCAISVVSGVGQSVRIPVANLEGWPAVSPRGDRVASNDLTGPAGERIYTATGTFLRNIVAGGGEEAFWAPDEQRLLIQGPGLVMFDFATRRRTAFRHAGPPFMQVLDWQSTGAGK